MTAEQKWEALKQYVEESMQHNRKMYGKYSKDNWVLWKLKGKLQELDPTVTNVGITYHEHEEKDYDVKGAK